jgi:hypothetical protein
MDTNNVNTICGRIMIRLSLLSLVSKHNMGSYYDCVVVVVRQTAVWETTARQLAKGEWKFRVASKIHFILAGLASNRRKASRNLKMLATITGYSFKIS